MAPTAWLAAKVIDMPDKDPRLDLIIAYREAGLHEKANDLVQEMLKEQTGANFDEMKNKLDQAGADLDNAVDKLAAKLGLPKRTRRKRRR